MDTTSATAKISSSSGLGYCLFSSLTFYPMRGYLQCMHFICRKGRVWITRRPRLCLGSCRFSGRRLILCETTASQACVLQKVFARNNLGKESSPKRWGTLPLHPSFYQYLSCGCNLIADTSFERNTFPRLRCERVFTNTQKRLKSRFGIKASQCLQGKQSANLFH